MNPSTLSGAIDIIVVRQKNGDLMCSPFHVRFGKLKLLNPSDKIVELTVNGNLVDINMKVGEAGEAFFVVETNNQVSSEYATSPIVHAVDTSEAPIVDPFLLGEDTKEDPVIQDERLDLEDIQSVVVNVDTHGLDDPRVGHDEIETDEKVGIKIPGARFEQDLATDKKMPANSPPWIWQWGGLPERSKEIAAATSNKELTLNRMVSSPVIGVTPAPQTGVMSQEEKVGKYLAELPVYKNSKRIAIDEPLDDIITINVINGVESTTNAKVQMSVCGPITEFQKLDAEKAKLKFEEKIVSFQQFCDSPQMLANPDILFRVNGYYHAWETAAPIIMAQVLYRQPLSISGVKKVLQRKQSRWSTWWAGDKEKLKNDPPKLDAPIKNDLKTKASEPVLRYSAVRSDSSTAGRPRSPQTIDEVQYAKSLRLSSDQLVM